MLAKLHGSCRIISSKAGDWTAFAAFLKIPPDHVGIQNTLMPITHSNAIKGRKNLAFSYLPKEP